VGQVLQVVDNDIGRTVAVKQLREGLRGPEMVARFVDEIRLVGQLEHPNIVPIHDVGQDEEGNYYFVMKYVEGETLESIIAKLAAGDREYHRRYPHERRVEIFAGVLEAIQYAHGRGIIHRDIKPANVMVGPYGEVMVMDWGIAKSVRGRAGVDLAVEGAAAGARAEAASPFATQVGALVGTPMYMSPEQALGHPLDERSDIYSLCVMLHELLTLEHYLEEYTTVTAVVAGVISDSPPLAMFMRHPHQSAVPADLTWLAARGVSKKKEDRYSSVSEMLAILRARAEGRIEIHCHLTFMKRLSRELLRFIDAHPVVMTLLMLLWVVGMGFGVVSLARR
jgi:serine/threonine-protein kinase